jgi:hypothetical protein
VLRAGPRSRQGIALLEMIVSVLVASVILAALTAASVGVRKSIAATHQYSVNAANETRLMDYVAQDLRRAVRVSMLNLTTGTSTVMKNYSGYSITETAVLSLRIPDYYASNTRDNTAGSSYKTSRYPRATLNTSATYNGSGTAKLNGIVPWADAVTTLNGKNITRFAPSSAGNGEIEVRYYRGARSTTDGSICFFRSEYPSGAATPSQVREIAERISDNTSTTSLVVTGKNDGLIFRLQSSFTPRYRFSGETTAGTEVFVEVSCRNARRD